jgi:hypothetical protein
MNEIQLAYVRGYRLALEDVLKDLKGLRDPPWTSGSDPDYYYGLGKQSILEEVVLLVSKTLASTTSTMNLLQRMEGESDHESREHGEVDQGPGDAPGQTGTSSLEDD